MNDNSKIKAAQSAAIKQKPTGSKPKTSVQGALRRFYQTATAEPATASDPDGGWRVLLDRRVLRTPGGAEVILPRPAAQALAAEWDAQSEQLRRGELWLTRLANTAIDRARGQEQTVIGDIAAYAESDLLCYRADWPSALAEHQAKAWDPLLNWCAEALGAQLRVITGIMPAPQPPEAGAAIRSALTRFDAFALTALHAMTTLTGSAVLALALAHRRIDAETAWQLAHLDEDWQIARWGEDAEAAAHRTAKWAEMAAAARFFSLLTEETAHGAS